MKIWLLPILLSSVLSLTACVEGKTMESVEELPSNHIIDTDETEAVDDSNNNDSEQEVEKPIVWLTEMSISDLEKNTQSCDGKVNRVKCIIICHIPSGNTEKYRSLMLPVEAIMAHLEHVGAKHDNHDFLGRCSDGLELGPEDKDDINYCDGNLSSFDCL
jgi:hypothetical protein